jgi:alpha-tubulin suppressor-like RCC1 family protein
MYTNVPPDIGTPQQVGTETNWQAVAAGFSHTLALRADGTLWAWGRQVSHQEDTFSATNAPYGPTPQRIGTNSDWQAISTSFHAVALRADGSLWTWGGNPYGQLGNGTYSDASIPQQVGTNTNWGPPP